MKIYEGDTFADVYSVALSDVYYRPEHVCSPRGQKVNEITNVAMVVNNPIYCLYHNPKRSSKKRYIAAELVYYFAGRRDLNFIKRYAKFWESIANSDGTVNSAYGDLIFAKKNKHGYSQWRWAFESFEYDKDSRQAILHFNTPEHQYFENKDFVCTLNGIFQIRDNKLSFTVEMRSNDIILGTATDIAFFCLLQQQMHKLLKENCYPELELGSYTHFVNSLHLYERNFAVAEKMLEVPIFDSERFHPIGENFIETWGGMTEEFEDLHDAIVADSEYSTDDVLFDWIYNEVKR